jgi:hypothetical protein
MSGRTPECSTPQRRPVRPKPVIISSAISKAPRPPPENEGGGDDWLNGRRPRQAAMG